MFPLDRELWLGVVHLWEGKVPGQVKLGCQDSVCESRSVLCSSLLAIVIIWVMKLFFLRFSCVFLPPLSIFCLC